MIIQFFDLGLLGSAIKSIQDVRELLSELIDQTVYFACVYDRVTSDLKYIYRANNEAGSFDKL